MEDDLAVDPAHDVPGEAGNGSFSPKAPVADPAASIGSPAYVQVGPANREPWEDTLGLDHMLSVMGVCKCAFGHKIGRILTILAVLRKEIHPVPFRVPSIEWLDMFYKSPEGALVWRSHAVQVYNPRSRAWGDAASVLRPQYFAAPCRVLVSPIAADSEPGTKSYEGVSSSTREELLELLGGPVLPFGASHESMAQEYDRIEALAFDEESSVVTTFEGSDFKHENVTIVSPNPKKLAEDERVVVEWLDWRDALIAKHQASKVDSGVQAADDLASMVGISSVCGRTNADYVDEELVNAVFNDIPENVRVAMMRVPQSSAIWLRFRLMMKSGSKVAALLDHNAYSTRTQQLDEIFDMVGALQRPSNPAMEWGKTYEPYAQEFFRRWVAAQPWHRSSRFWDVGMFLPDSKQHSLLRGIGYSPDDVCVINGERVLVEYKCPYQKPDRPPKMPYTHMPPYYMDQVQLGMGLVGAKVCYFVVWTPQKATVSQTEFDPAYFQTIMLPHLRAATREYLQMRADIMSV